ncbi:hypothetical protein K438DRAFT_1767836 [Mycena galopus ATCC 62051]|nr:hypothetical protein K438DRAFT_1767836 [Mycena galopus ATCC 62051]
MGPPQQPEFYSKFAAAMPCKCAAVPRQYRGSARQCRVNAAAVARVASNFRVRHVEAVGRQVGARGCRQISLAHVSCSKLAMVTKYFRDMFVPKQSQLAHGSTVCACIEAIAFSAIIPRKTARQWGLAPTKLLFLVLKPCGSPMGCCKVENSYAQLPNFTTVTATNGLVALPKTVLLVTVGDWVASIHARTVPCLEVYTVIGLGGGAREAQDLVTSKDSSAALRSKPTDLLPLGLILLTFLSRISPAFVATTASNSAAAVLGLSKFHLANP